VLTFLEGQTVGETRPWPAWVHSDTALEQVADWLSGYHGAVADFVPPADAVWREGRSWRPGSIIVHGDPGAYNAVWDAAGLVGFVDWDMAGPSTREADVAWTAFSWVPLHARRVVAAEGFTAFGQRRKRLEAFLGRYGWEGSTGDVLDPVAARIEEQLHAMRERAAAGDAVYQRMLEGGRDDDLRSALEELADI
jgi:aminoglycoside phosphotransferase (APT) family kinase protein